MSIASEITRLQNAKSALKTSINAKTDSSHQINNETLDEYSDFVDSIQTGGGGSTVEEKDVNFYDYDGTLVDSYSKADFLALNSLPENPIHDGLTAQGWNWSLTDAKNYVTSYDELDIGQMYVTDDGATRIYIHLEEGRLSPYLGFAIDGTATVDWGDNSATTTVTGNSTSTLINTQHNYASSGDYVISISSTSKIYINGSSTYGSQLLWNNLTNVNFNKSYTSAIIKLELHNCNLSTYSFCNLFSLKTVILSNSITLLENGVFNNCYSLTNVVIPTSITSLGNNVFTNCYCIKHILLSKAITTIGNNVFSYCSAMNKLILPNSVTSIGDNVFNYCGSLKKVILPNSVTTTQANVFTYCYSLENVILSNNMTTLNNSFFFYCHCLKQIILPSTITTINSGSFRYCSSLVSLKIPSGVSTIDTYTFNSCYSLSYLDFSDHTSVPSLAATNALGNTPTDLKIIVPDSLYSTWIAATNWSSLASKIIKESDFNA